MKYGRPYCTTLPTNREWWKDIDADCRLKELKRTNVGDFYVCPKTTQPVPGQAWFSY